MFEFAGKQLCFKIKWQLLLLISRRLEQLSGHKRADKSERRKVREEKCEWGKRGREERADKSEPIKVNWFAEWGEKWAEKRARRKVSGEKWAEKTEPRKVSREKRVEKVEEQGCARGCARGARLWARHRHWSCGTSRKLVSCAALSLSHRSYNMFGPNYFEPFLPLQFLHY